MAVKEFSWNLHILILMVAFSSIVLIISTKTMDVYVSPEDVDTNVSASSSVPWPEGQQMFVFGYEENAPLFEIENIYAPLMDDLRRLLEPTVVPNTFFYVWCGRRPFTFRNYLSVLSVIRYMRPDNIVFYYKSLPLIDEETLYNTWFEELRKNYPFVSTVKLNSTYQCSGTSKPYYETILSVLAEFGGTYISEGTVLTRTLDLDVEFQFRWDDQNEEGFVSAAPGITKNMTTRGLFQKREICPNVTLTTERTIYTPQLVFNTPPSTLEKISKDTCMVIDGVFYPRDFWTRPDSLGDEVRRIIYGKPDIRKPVKNPQVVVPNIAHMIWVGGGTMDFLFYLSVLSCVYIQRVENLYIHGDLPPSGQYWDILKDIPQVIFRYRSYESLQIYGNSVGSSGESNKHDASHLSDVIRGDIMLRWGGIYIDTDAFFVKKLPEDLMRYDTVSHYSFARRLPYPDTFVSGFLLAKPGAEFFVRFQQSMKSYNDSNWMYNALLAPYKIMERYPYLVHIEPRMQVVCLYEKCHPTWVPNFKNMSLHHLNTGSLPNWREDTNVYHFCSGSTPKALKSITALKEASDNDMFAQMGRLILQRAER